jgi:transcriptional regulator with XRE-family HTH domain
MFSAKFHLMAKGFGDLVRLARIDKGWSQRELARRIGKSATYIHYVERNFNPSAQNQTIQVGEEAVTAIAKALGINSDEARLAAG